MEFNLARAKVLNSKAKNAEDVASKLALVHDFFSGTGPTYDFIVNVATLGIDHWWKRTIIGAIPTEPNRVLDLACGTGILTFAIARRFPHCQVVGVELRDEYLQIARAKAESLGLKNVEFVLSRAEDYASEQNFDCVVSSYLAKYADLPLLTRNTKNMLTEGGLLLMHDFTYPPNAILVGIWRVYFKLLQLFGTPLYPAWREIFYGLPDLIERPRWRDELLSALDANGFETIRSRNLTLYGSAIVTAERPARN